MLACEGRLPKRSKRKLEFELDCELAIVLVFACLNNANCLSNVHWLFVVVVVVVLSIVKKRILSVSRGNVIRL